MGIFKWHILSPVETFAKVEAMSDSRSIEDLPIIICCRAFCKTQANSSSDIASLHDDWILVSTLHDSLDLAAKFRPDSPKNPFKPSKRV